MSTPETTPESTPPAYPAVPAHPSFPALEHEVLDFWAADGTFEASVDARAAGENGANEYVFYDGPPFANGLPHYGHLLTGYVKDVVPRYRTMRGRRVERRFGWDTHGLPAEVEAEHQLGIKHKSEIEEMGVAAFNDACRASVLRYTDEWRAYVTRQARWVDFDNDYKTLDLDYMESVMWAFKTLWDKGLVYSGFRVLWYCWRCETPLSATETKMDDVYTDRQDPAVTVGLRLRSRRTHGPGRRATPWSGRRRRGRCRRTWPSRCTRTSSTSWSRRRTPRPTRASGSCSPRPGWAPTRASWATSRACCAGYTGAELLGTAYLPPFDFFAGRENAHRVLAADYVTTDDGTGLVHIAPAFGEEDKVVTDAAGIEAVVPGRHAAASSTPRCRRTQGMHVFDANPQIIRDLRTGAPHAQGCCCATRPTTTRTRTAGAAATR